ncbi:hypothetical protein DH2020_049109 [Rehmannia glutinosa]|uniref:Uncharacterized protein n=1 Tax=Rehmannia glutinosa TaxID=99300 RepID=A0ABR0U4P1_REHGL
MSEKTGVSEKEVYFKSQHCSFFFFFFFFSQWRFYIVEYLRWLQQRRFSFSQTNALTQFGPPHSPTTAPSPTTVFSHWAPGDTNSVGQCCRASFGAERLALSTLMRERPLPHRAWRRQAKPHRHRHPPTTQAEFAIGSAAAKTSDVGWSTATTWGSPCGHRWLQESRTRGCAADINASCPRELQVVDGGGAVVACKCACVVLQSPEYCCTGEHSSPETCQATSYSEM